MSKQLLGGAHAPVDKPENYSPHAVVTDRNAIGIDEKIDYSRFPLPEFRGCFSEQRVHLTFPCDDMGTPLSMPIDHPSVCTETTTSPPIAETVCQGVEGRHDRTCTARRRTALGARQLR
jgi:hypothetical protein